MMLVRSNAAPMQWSGAVCYALNTVPPLRCAPSHTFPLLLTIPGVPAIVLDVDMTRFCFVGCRAAVLELLCEELEPQVEHFECVDHPDRLNRPDRLV